MNDMAIQVEGLSKQYNIGSKQKRNKTLRETLTDSIASSFGQVGRLVRGQASDTAGLDATIWALRDVSFAVKHGEVVGIIGHNGAGKTTLLKILSSITEPTEGYARIRGRVGSLLEVGTGFHSELTGRENIYLNGAILGMKKAEIARKFDEIVAFAEVEKFLDTPVKHYSSGMRVRLAFAVAAHLEPEILLVDEVLAVGDAAFQKKCLGKMGEVAGQGRTVLYVSHNMASVQALCCRGILLQHGTVNRDASAAEAIGTYLQSLEQYASRDLLDRVDRRGKGQVRISRVTVSTDGTDASGTLVTGRPAEFVFHLSAQMPRLTCMFTIYDHLGQPVAHFNSNVRSPEDLRDPALGAKMICQIDDLPLVTGRYRINVAIMSGDLLQDHLEAAAMFDVEQGVFRGRPVSRDIGYGKVVLHHRWISQCDS
jgi:lipopolysaccharide transport system ATP-binding protein